MILAATLMTNLSAAQEAPAGKSGRGNEPTPRDEAKNVQLLKGISDTQMHMTMDFVANSIGVRCSHCHVVDSSGWHYEREDKPPKLTGRKMMQMVMDLNAKTFGGRTAVSTKSLNHSHAHILMYSHTPSRISDKTLPLVSNSVSKV